MCSLKSLGKNPLTRSLALLALPSFFCCFPLPWAALHIGKLKCFLVAISGSGRSRSSISNPADFSFWMNLFSLNGSVYSRLSQLNGCLRTFCFGICNLYIPVQFPFLLIEPIHRFQELEHGHF